MLFVNYKIDAPRADVLNALRDNDSVLEILKFDTSKGRPRMHVYEKDKRVKIVCEIVDGPTRDRDFKMGTAFRGKLTESNGTTSIKGIILTAPIYHAVLLALFAFFIYRCISLGAISVVPICILIFDILMFLGEFKKQGVIKRYIFNAMKLTYRRVNKIN